VEPVDFQQPELLRIDSAKGFIESLLLPKTEGQPRRDYVCCAFELGGRSYFLPIRYMVEISEAPPLLQLPLAPAVVKGLINLRGQVIPVIDLSVLQQESSESDQCQRLVVAEFKGEKLAFLAEGMPYLSEAQVGEVIDLPKFISHHRIRGAEA
jgi:chemotaxis signal transduction protein